MQALSKEQSARRERTLLVALLLGAWSPLTMGVAVLLGRSTTQLADFIRRSVELMALFVSWMVFRHITHHELSSQAQAKLERWTGWGVAASLFCSGLVMLGLALSRIHSFQPGGNVYPGLVFGSMGVITNAWFWWRYYRLDWEQSSPIISAQIRLYRAKCLVGLCVIVALTAVAIDPAHTITRYIDILGTIVVSVYLLWSGYSSARSASSIPVPVPEGHRDIN